MTIAKARALCTRPELDLVLASRPAAMDRTGETRLRARVRRARDLRDKYRDLARRQRLEARGKRGAAGTRPAAGNERTVLKARLFGEVLDRLEGGLRRLARERPQAKGAADSKRPSPRAKTPVRRQQTRRQRRQVAQATRATRRRAARA